MKSTGSTRVAVAALLIAASATGATAQSVTRANTDEIATLEMDARDYLNDLSKWDRAATLFRRAAQLRPAGDATATEDLLYAARLSFYEGSERQAIRDFEAAGQRALAMGDVLLAANAFADAAWVAQHRGYGERAHALIERAQLLSNSPLIAENERELLRARWEVTGAQQ